MSYKSPRGWGNSCYENQRRASGKWSLPAASQRLMESGRVLSVPAHSGLFSSGCYREKKVDLECIFDFIFVLNLDYLPLVPVSRFL